MSNKTFPSVFRRISFLGFWIVSSVFVSNLTAGPVRIKVDAANSTATITAPKNSSSVVVEVRETKNGAWKVYKNLQIKTAPATVQVALPDGFQTKSWRASVGTATLPASKPKYPQKFFIGKKVFQGTVASSYVAGSPSSTVSPLDLKAAYTSGRATSVSGPVIMADSASATTSPTASTSASAEEADIWKVDGTTAYFFNQYRGLQVIDLSDPSNPSLKAYYRLPAKGQDLYIVSSQGDVKNVILITEERDGSTGVNLLSVKGSKIALQSTLPVSGWMADSRMVGTRLYLATQTWGWDSSYDCITRLNEVIVNPLMGSLSSGSQFPVKGSWPVISAGGEWLAVSTSDSDDWQTSKVTLFSLRESGVSKTFDAIPLFGRVYDKDHMGYDRGCFSAVSERWVGPADSQNSSWSNGTRVTTLQNFSFDGTQLASLEIQRGETLYAAKFAGNKAYVVTALQVDPLFVIDLSDPRNPILAGQLKVPGFSTRIVPLPGERLFTIGFDGSNKVSASVFGVTDPKNPVQISSISLRGKWGYSAATYDDKALKVLSEAGVALIPYTSYSESWIADRYVQIVKLNTNSGSLSLGGAITNRFDPLRATVLGSTMVSISQKDLVTADISNPDAPKVLADLLLAWPVNRILETGSHLLQISDGSSWYGGTPSLVVTSLNDPDNVLSELSLGDGSVKDAALAGETLRVLRQKDTNIIMDIYGLGSLPDVNLLGSATSTFRGNSRDVQVGKMLSASSNCIVSVVQPNARCWNGGYPRIAIDPATSQVGASTRLISNALTVQPASVTTAGSGTVAQTIFSPDNLAVSSACLVDFRSWWRSFGSKSQPASAVIFSLRSPGSPLALPSVSLTDTNAGAVNVSEAAGGLLVVGYANDETPSKWMRFRYCPLVAVDDGTGSAVVSTASQGSEYGLLSSAKHKMRILDLQDPSAPVLGPVQDLPGKLLAVSDLSRDGFLAWTETCDTTRKVQVSACNGTLLSQVTSLNVDFGAPIAVANRHLFAAYAKENGSIISRWTLTETATLQASGSISLPWMPSSIRTSVATSAFTLYGTDGVNIFSSLWSPGGPQDSAILSWEALLWFDPSLISLISGGGIAVPEGDYGAEIFRP